MITKARSPLPEPEIEPDTPSVVEDQAPKRKRRVVSGEKLGRPAVWDAVIEGIGPGRSSTLGPYPTPQGKSRRNSLQRRITKLGLGDEFRLRLRTDGAQQWVDVSREEVGS